MEILNSLPPDPHWTQPLPHGDGSSWLYAIMIILGFAAAIALSCIKMWKRYKISVEPFYWFILIGVPLAILGANFGSCVLWSFWHLGGEIGTPPGKPWSEFFTKFGSGLAIEWGVMFVVIAACIYFPLILKLPRYRVRDELGPKPAVKRVSMWLYFDAVMPCILLAQFLGRWGNYFNQEVYGSVVTNEGLAWFLYKCLPGMYINGAWHQPLFLWEGLGNLVMFFVLYIGVEFIKQRKVGDMAAGYLIWYGVFRACLEPLREQSFKSNASIVLSIIFAVIGALFVVFNHLFMARARNVKGTKLFFSNLNLVYVSTFFTSKKSIQKKAPKKIEKLTGKLNKFNESKPQLLEKYKSSIQNKINKYLNEINQLKNRNDEYSNNVTEIYNKKIEALNNKIVDYQDKLEFKSAKIKNKIFYYKNYDLYMAYKVLDCCESKYESLDKLLVATESGKTKLNLTKLEAKYSAQEHTLHNATAIADNVKSNISSWTFPQDYVRTESELVYYCRY